MRMSFRSVLRLVALAGALVLGAAAQAQTVTLLPNTDLPGFDYATSRGMTLESCRAACVEDRICRAFTFNGQNRWCFLKSEAGPETAYPRATSGRVEPDVTPEELAAERSAEISPYLPSEIFEEGRRFAAELTVTDPPRPGATYEGLVGFADRMAAEGNPVTAATSFRQALAITGTDPEVWLKLAEAALARYDVEIQAQNPRDEVTRAFATLATNAAVNAFLRADSVAERAGALGALAGGMERRAMYRPAIRAYRDSLALVADATLERRLDAVVAQYGFRVTSNEVDVEGATPRLCVVFSEALPDASTDLSQYVTIAGGDQLSVETEGNQICMEGVEHGRRYQVRLRAGLPSADGEVLSKDAALSIFVPDREPFVGFAGNAYVLPAGLGGGLPLTSVNAETAKIAVYRVGDRSIAAAIRNGIFLDALEGYSAASIVDNYGEQVWEGEIDLAGAETNATALTAVPIREIVTDIKPGAYVITAKLGNSEDEYWEEMATQWFIVTDLGLTAISGDDGVHAFVRSLGDTAAVAGARVRLVAVNNEVLGEATTDSDGRADFAPGLARGKAGMAPRLIVAETEAGDYAFLDIGKTPFELTDRGVEGRPSPGPLDLFMTSERGVYRPGETVFLTGLLRDSLANAVTGLPLTLVIERPDGVEYSRQVLADAGAGGYHAALYMVGDAMRGSWRARAYADPKGEALASATFLVEDFEPERLAFDIAAPEGPVSTDDVTTVEVSARYLYGASAPDLDIEADAVLRPVSRLAAFPGFVFGRADDTVETIREPLGVVGTTAEDGSAIAEVNLPLPQPGTRPLEAQIIMRLRDSTGRTVERSLTRPVRADGDRLGVRPLFPDGNAGEGAEAAFELIAVDPDGNRTGKDGVRWTLSRIETDYQWYRSGGSWQWETITTTRRVGDGTVDIGTGDATRIGALVDWGSYRLEVESDGDSPTSTSYEFDAGYYRPETGSNTPDVLEVALDKDGYRIGDTANLRLSPQFAGTALVMVVDNRIIDMVAVDVPAEGISVALPVTAEWGPGAYVTAMLYRPASAAEKRMPARAIGLAFADVEPGDRQLQTTLDTPAETLPRRPFTATVRLGNVAAGQKAYVAVAAVDLGILNLTNFKAPAPDDWYFGQRELGVELRDLYGQLIDPTQGIAGAIRSGGDGDSARLGTPPATSVLVALHSGIVEVGPDGAATVSFEMPDFSGTVRVMAMAWTADAVGHAVSDVIVRDPVVVTLSPPRFLRVDDAARLLVEINNVAGPAGNYTVVLGSGDGISVTGETETGLTLAAGERTALDLQLTGLVIGDHDIDLTLRAPTGDALIKQLKLGVRAANAPMTTSALVSIGPGESLTLDGSRFADLLPGSGILTLAVGPIARLDVPNLLLKLDRYPYGCAEQITSRAMPLLYLNEVAKRLGMDRDGELTERIRAAVANLLSKQKSNGAFGLWGPYSSSDLWLDSYVTEFLLRARDENYVVAEQALTMALDNLSNQVAYSSDFTNGGEDVAYALYTLARAGRATLSDLRYYAEARLTAFATPLAKAQIGAALALYGDRGRSATAFDAAVSALGRTERDDRYSYRSDYGSRLRDTAAVLALAAEFKPAGVDLSALTQDLAGQRDFARYTSTQEDVWTLMAAAALGRGTGDGSVSIDGTPLTGAVYQSFDQAQLEATPSTVTNSANRPTEAMLSVTGIRAVAPPASSDGFTITREYFLLDGTPADLSAVRQNDRFVVRLSLTADRLGSGQYVVADPLPAGFEIENPNLAASGVADFAWLEANVPSHTEARTDQFVAAFRFTGDAPSFSTAYLVRAVTPGTFVHPGATVEDMYRPELRANTAAGELVVAAP